MNCSPASVLIRVDGNHLTEPAFLTVDPGALSHPSGRQADRPLGPNLADLAEAPHTTGEVA